jgi:superfamily II DNA or RNA helicase
MRSDNSSSGTQNEVSLPRDPISRPQPRKRKKRPPYDGAKALVNKLPQAEDLDKVILAVEHRSLGKEKLTEILGRDKATGKVNPRNVNYYIAAAVLLGMLDPEGYKTPHGRALAYLEPDEQIIRLSFAFEHSEVGREWMRFKGVKSLPELDPSSAAPFVRHFRGEHPETKTWTRRTQTLEKWCSEMNEARQQPRVTFRHHTYADIDSAPATIAFDRGTSGRIIREVAWKSSRLDIATAYFRLEGFREIHRALYCTSIRLLIGSDDASRQDIETLLKIFRASLNPGRKVPLDEQRVAVRDLYALITSGRLSLAFFEACETNGLHAKAYIGEGAAYVGSANLTLGGLRKNVEDGLLTTDPPQITYLRERFDRYWSEAEPITERIARAIEETWGEHLDPEPYLIYLKVLDELFGHLSRVGASGYALAEFQKAIVATALRRLEHRKRLLLIAPTGIGKMVMGVYIAKVLTESKKVRRTIVVCKNAILKALWVDKLRSFGLGYDLTSVYALERAKHPSDGIGDLARLFKSLSSEDLIIVDESHHFRREESQRSQTLAEFVLGPDPAAPPFALFLTATPMSVDLTNINQQLDILGAPKLTELAEAVRSPAILNVAIGPVMKSFGGEPQGDFVPIDFGGVEKYLAHITIKTVRYDSNVEAILAEIPKIDVVFEKVNKAATHSLLSDEEGGHVEADDSNPYFVMRGLRSLLARRAESSIEALEATIRNLQASIDSGDLVPRPGSNVVEQLALLATLSAAVSREVATVPKLKELLRIVRGLDRGMKVLIFSEYKPTVKRLGQVLRAVKGDLVEVVTGEVSDRKKREIFCRFAPLAQGIEVPIGPDIDTLVATDTMSEGENLQDASILINYDLTWTPLTLIQRVGRVDRFTREKRQIKVFNFHPGSSIFNQMVDIEKTVLGRSKEQKRLSGTAMIDEAEEHTRSAALLRGVPVEILHKIYYDPVEYPSLRSGILDEVMPPSEFFSALWKAEPADLQQARALSGCAMATCFGKTPGLLALLGIGEKKVLLWRGDSTGEIHSAPEPLAYEEILSMVETPPRVSVELSAKDLTARDRLVDTFVESWRSQSGLSSEAQMTYIAVLEIVAQTGDRSTRRPRASKLFEDLHVVRTPPTPPARVPEADQIPLFGPTDGPPK